MRLTLTLRSGGQTGVDRAALEAATRLGLSYVGWCPSGGWAEDHPIPPGVRSAYPNLVETPSTDPRQRTAWNVRDADATLILSTDRRLDLAPGTRFTRLCAELLYSKPWAIDDLQAAGPSDAVVDWLSDQFRLRPNGLDLNVAGPRESESAGVQDRALEVLLRLLR